MGTTTRILIPSLLVLCLYLLPLLTPQQVQLQLKELIASLYPSSSEHTVLENQQSTLQTNETKIYTLSTNPLVIYIQNFVTPAEASQLVALSNDNFGPSPLYSDDGTLIHDPSYRSSQTATLPSSPIVHTIEARSRSLPFYDLENQVKIKPLVVQKYGVGKEYKDHFDWFLPNPSLTGNIHTSIFIYISANCTGGGTNFPRLFLQSSQSQQSQSASSSTPQIQRGGKEDSWCEFVDCDRPYDEGVTFLPIAGNAIFWQNTNPITNEGIPQTLHAGLPVTGGEKMGLNVWGWKNF